jgi:hypothetical protein
MRVLPAFNQLQSSTRHFFASPVNHNARVSLYTRAVLGELGFGAVAVK